MEIDEDISNISEDEKVKEVDIFDIIEKSDKKFINLKTNNSFVKISPYSIEKIFSLIIDNDMDNLSDICAENIVINIVNSNDDLKDSNNNSNNNSDDDKIIKNDNLELENKYITVLENADIFFINFESIKNRNEINKNSLIKIFNYLDKSLMDMSDYINLIILYLDKNKKNEMAKLSIEHKILGKYKKNNTYNRNNDIYFNGKKRLDLDLPLPKNNKSHNIYELDMIFNRVLDCIDDYELESSFSDNINNLIIPRKSIEEDLIKVVNVSFIEDSILTDGNGDNNEKDDIDKENKRAIKKNHRRTPSNISQNSEGGSCNQKLCNGMCNIF